MPKITLPLGFNRVTACLQRDSSLLAPIETPPKTRWPDILPEPMVTTMYATCLVWDEAIGVTYMDMVTASVGAVALGSPCMVAILSGATVEELAEEDLMD